MGTTPNIRVKGMSRIAYNFLWDSDIRHYAYTPKNQKEADDIFRTQGKIYHHMYFSVWLDKKKPEEKKSVAKPKKAASKPKKLEAAAVENS
jgi:hypothetical protein